MPRPLRTLLALALLTLPGCATRPLTEPERAFSATLQGAGLDPAPVRVTRGLMVAGIPTARESRPYVTCRERIHPPEPDEKVRWTVAGMVLGQHLYTARRVYEPDFLKGYPVTLPLADAMFFAHEMTHVWQWQNRATTGYAPWRAAAEHGAKDDPYLFDLTPGRAFADYGYEQQAALVEEFVCCRALDPGGARTERLHALLLQAFPDLPRRDPAGHVDLPWKAAETRGICSG